MRAFTCPICGGKLNIKIGTEYAACDLREPDEDQS